MVIDFSINIVGVLVATVVSFIFGWIWYGPIFGRIWAKENKIKNSGEMPIHKLLFHFLTNLLLVIGVALLFSGTIIEGIILALVLWLGIFVSVRASSMIWMKQSWIVFFIDITYHLVNLIIIIFILSLF